MIKNKSFIGLIIICLIILGLLTATYFLNIYNRRQLSLVIEKNNDTNYECLLLKNEDSYQEFLTKYDIKDNNKKDFLKYDYIVAFITYKEKLEIISVDVVQNEDVTIYFETNPKVEEDSDKLMIYFIPIDKNAINNLENVKQIYK